MSPFLHVLRSILHFWGIALLNIAGLTIGTAAALIIALYVRDELNFDHFIPESDSLFLLTSVYSSPDTPIVTNDKAPAGMSTWLLNDASSVDATTRLYPGEWIVESPRFHGLDKFYWADPNVFDLLRFKAVSGDLKTALDRPFTMVVTQRIARKYFGRDNVVGQTLYINGGSPVQITAVLPDFPGNTSFKHEMFISGATNYGMLSVLDSHPDWQWASCYTLVRPKKGRQLDADAARSVAKKHWRNLFNLPAKFSFVALTDLHFQPESDSQMAPRGHKDTVITMSFVAALILFLAALNFAGLMAAQINERSAEMKIRHSLGAQRHHLFRQLFTEAAVIVGLSIMASLALAEQALPLVNTFLGLDLSVWTSPGFTMGCVVLAALTALAGGLYPAFILSNTPSHRILVNPRALSRRQAPRVGWITVQFAMLIMLLISAHTVYRQWQFAVGPALNFDAENVVQLDVYKGGGLNQTFMQKILTLPGVEDAAYSRFMPEATDMRPGRTFTSMGRPVQFTRQSVDPNFFRMFKVRVLAGRTFHDTYDADRPAKDIILSISAVKALGYQNPAEVVDKVLNYEGDHTHLRSRIIGVVDDMRIETVREPLRPMVFDNQSYLFNRLNIKLTSYKQAATLLEIDRIWKQTYPNAAYLRRHPYSNYLSDLYNDIVQQWRAFCLLSAVGVCISILGITGLSIYLTRTRLQETSIRSALGASTLDLVLIRLQPFIMPLIFANILAIVLAWGLMTLWLRSFAVHVSLDPVSFVLASGVATLTAFVTLTLHAASSVPARSSQPLRAF